MECNGLAATIIGTHSLDLIPTTPGNDVVVGGNGEDTIQASAGNDTICGDQFRDTINYSATPGPAVVDLPRRHRDAAREDRRCVRRGASLRHRRRRHAAGTDADAEIRGNGGNDILNGRGGQDAITGGADDGGIGDMVVFDNAPGNVTADLTSNAFQNTGNGSKLLDDIESIRGGPFNDQLTGDGAANTINGAAGTDTVHASGGADTVIGGAGADNLFGEAGDDFMDALDGEIDNVDCGEGADTTNVDGTDVLVACDAATPPDTTPPDTTPSDTTPPDTTPVDTTAPVLTLSGKKRQKVWSQRLCGSAERRGLHRGRIRQARRHDIERKRKVGRSGDAADVQAEAGQPLAGARHRGDTEAEALSAHPQGRNRRTGGRWVSARHCDGHRNRLRRERGKAEPPSTADPLEELAADRVGLKSRRLAPG